MKRVALSAILVLLMGCGAFAQTAPDAAELTRLLNEFLAGASHSDAAVHERFWADDLIYTRSAGRRVNKAEIMRDLRSAPAPKPTDPKTVYTAEDVQIQQYGDTAIVAFRLVSTTEAGGTKQVASNLNSGTFLKREGKWQVVSWQSTRMPRTEAESKSEVATVEAAFQQALASADIDRLTALTDSAFTLNGLQTTRKQLLDELRAGRFKYTKPDASKTMISIFGDTALAHGNHFTLTFVNQAGVWRAIAMQTYASQ
ncbi:MAG TPA: nuclear transport factor 2 family protein [Pyrinomonadaceae bacterium]|nr:nuclear transport factor 2 family protein [Pyrinomonadaceae bacterium]